MSAFGPYARANLREGAEVHASPKRRGEPGRLAP